MSYQDLVDKDVRRELLSLLAQDGAYSANASVLKRALAMLGYAVSTDKLATELSWLAEQRLVKLDNDGVLVATLTARGLDVVLGAASVPGVARPQP